LRVKYLFNPHEERWDLLKEFVKGKTIDFGSEETLCHQNVCPNALRVDIKGKPDIKANLDENLPIKSSSFDTVVAGYILEHLYHPFEFLKECHRVLRNKGRILISIPNMSSLPYFLDENKDVGIHIHGWNMPMLEHYLKKAGFRIIFKKKINDWYRRNLLFRFLCWLIPNWRVGIVMVEKK
jgi:predicted SAM-dependent methyltransferase